MLTNVLGTTTFSFDFKLTNPSRHQDAPGVGLVLSYLHSDLSNNSMVVFNRVAWDNYATNNGSQSVIASSGVGLDLTSTIYPMKIGTAVVTSSIRQSSPFPCDANKITLTITSTVDLYVSCSPVLSLTGLTGADTPSGNLNVNYVANGGTLRGSQAAAWVQDTGTLTFNLGTAQTVTILLKTQEMVLDFMLTNPRDAQMSPTTLLFMQLVDKPMGFHAVATHVSDSMAVYDGTMSLDLTSQTSCSASSGDAHPLLIRSVVVTTFTVSQSSFFPCANNSLTVLLRTDGPLFQTCVPQLTLAGLRGSVTTSDPNLATTVTPSGAFAASGEWTNAGGAGLTWDNSGAIGTLLLPLVSGAFIKGCNDYAISFVLANPVRPQAAASVTLTVPAVISGSKVWALSGTNADPMKVMDVVWQASISGSSTDPCDMNLVTVVVAPSINLCTSCVEYLELTGLGGSMTNTSTDFKMHDASSPQFASTADWLINGTLKVFLDSDLLANQQYSFSLSL